MNERDFGSGDAVKGERSPFGLGSIFDLGEGETANASTEWLRDHSDHATPAGEAATANSSLAWLQEHPERGTPGGKASTANASLEFLLRRQ